MITRLSVGNFKAWRKIDDMRLAPITGLFGPNSSGKTSLLQLLLLLKQTTESADRQQPLHLGDERSLVDLGTFPDVIFGHDRALPLSWKLSWEPSEAVRVTDPANPDRVLFEDKTIAFTAQLAWHAAAGNGAGRVVVQRFAYELAGRTFSMISHRGDKTPSELTYDLEASGQGFRFNKGVGRPPLLPPPMKCYGFPDTVRAAYQNAGFLSDLELAFESLFERVYYLGPLREYPRRHYPWAGGEPHDMGQRGERVVDALLAARDRGTTISPGTRKRKVSLDVRVATWLKALGLVESFRIEPVAPASKLYQVLVRREKTTPEVPITDVGFGVSQILPVIALCYYVPEGSTLILEQPEIHLHPRIQASLADVFIDATKTRGVQIILESHSEHLLRRLQRRVAEETLPAEDVALYFCARDANGAARLDPLDVDTLGNIGNWPAEFFGDEFGEIAAMSKAQARRRQRAMV